MNIKKYRLLASILLSFFLTISNGQQKITLNESGLFIDGNAVLKTITQEDVKKILGEPDSKFEGQNTIWTYDKKGICFYFDKNDEHFKSFEIDFINKDYTYSPKLTYHGRIFLFNLEINKNTSLIDLKKTHQLIFRETPYTVQRATTKTNIVYFDFGLNGDRLQHISFSPIK